MLGPAIPEPLGDDESADGEVSVPPPARPRMQVVVLSSQKGGSGKSTLCGHLAVMAGLAGCGPVAVIDTDPQGTLTDWRRARASPAPLLVRSDAERLSPDLAALRRQGVQLAFIDTPPSVTNVIRQIIRYADLVVIPTRPSPHDLRAVGATIDMVEDQGRPLVFAINAATPRNRLTSDTAIALSQHGTVAPVFMHHRVDFAKSMIDGRTVMELDPSGLSARQVAELWTYLAGRLGRAERRDAARGADGAAGAGTGFASALQTRGDRAIFGRRSRDG